MGKSSGKALLFENLKNFLKQNKDKSFSYTELLNTAKNIRNNHNIKLAESTLNGYLNEFIREDFILLHTDGTYSYINFKEKDIYTRIGEFMKNNNLISSFLVSNNIKLPEQITNRPDILGISNFPLGSYPPEITSIEVKIPKIKSEIYTAIGQCCFYKTFSNYVYVALPEESFDKEQLMEVCQIEQIGLISFQLKNQVDFNLLLPAVYRHTSNRKIYHLYKNNFG